MNHRGAGKSARILVVGQGAREHALVWALSRSSETQALWVAPGNAGTSREPKTRNISIDSHEVDTLANFARQENMDLVVIGPEAPLMLGLSDRLTAQGTAVIGPRQDAARLEGSKIFCKRFCQRHGIPTAPARIHEKPEDALRDVATCPLPIVIKASGLCGGKGVVIATSREEAETAVRKLSQLPGGQEGLLVEECLDGWETSYIVLAEETTYLPCPPTQDHKRLEDGNRGPNTGGMGAFSPANLVTPELETRICHQIIEPTLRALAQSGHPYQGFLYAGVMIDKSGDPHLLEFNCRLGDPEAQVILFRLLEDLPVIFEATVEQRLHEVHWTSGPEAALTTILAASGYPETQSGGGEPIEGLDAPEEGTDLKVFHGATRKVKGRIVCAGGRVLAVTGRGPSLTHARDRVYARIDSLQFAGMQYRKDIGA
jgi:phosphoribosylamine--glycine ligase